MTIATYLTDILGEVIDANLVQALSTGVELCSLFPRYMFSINFGDYDQNAGYASSEAADNIGVFARGCESMGIPSDLTLKSEYFLSDSIEQIVMCLSIFIVRGQAFGLPQTDDMDEYIKNFIPEAMQVPEHYVPLVGKMIEICLTTNDPNEPLSVDYDLPARGDDGSPSRQPTPPGGPFVISELEHQRTPGDEEEEEDDDDDDMALKSAAKLNAINQLKDSDDEGAAQQAPNPYGDSERDHMDRLRNERIEHLQQMDQRNMGTEPAPQDAAELDLTHSQLPSTQDREEHLEFIRQTLTTPIGQRASSQGDVVLPMPDEPKEEPEEEPEEESEEESEEEANTHTAPDSGIPRLPNYPDPVPVDVESLQSYARVRQMKRDEKEKRKSERMGSLATANKPISDSVARMPLVPKTKPAPPNYKMAAVTGVMVVISVCAIITVIVFLARINKT